MMMMYDDDDDDCCEASLDVSFSRRSCKGIKNGFLC